jgi:hypothetical protein
VTRVHLVLNFTDRETTNELTGADEVIDVKNALLFFTAPVNGNFNPTAGDARSLLPNW